MVCPGGFKYIQDKNGCKTCTCHNPEPGKCPPAPTVKPVCAVNPQMKTPDCVATGCPAGKVCCPDPCSGSRCVNSYTGPTQKCPPSIAKNCDSLPFPMKDKCANSSSCSNGQICCPVTCSKSCYDPIPITLPSPLGKP
ncbi:WAP four-disulfide core domain protein 5-like [Gigantopelta aegis]|uniref:WAP four-disulfide core domain protein 5-like n=1 Tax=Gigantopelta aegis TaxID=1735272 RepID=UPI001B88C3CA|nr:WAP four-disulfide core domain protein 5-like [Gigantopelta aegis]